LKVETRVIGIDDGNTRLRRRFVVGAIFRGGLWIDGIVTSVVDVAVSSLGEKLATMVRDSRFHRELRIALLHGTILSHMNAADLIAFQTITKLPTIAILRGKQAELIRQTTKKTSTVYFALKGNASALGLDLTVEEALEILNITSLGGAVPEPIRVAGLIASALNSPKRLNWAVRSFRGGS
jgi:endonuclease V-like protein UPF0215 family